METKSFVLRRDNHASIVKLIGSDTIAVVRPEKYVENLFRELIHRTIVEKKSGKAELESVLEYFRSISSEAAYLEKVDEFEQMVKAYLSEGMFVYAPLRSVEDYLLARCARLCAEAVACGVKGSRVIDGTGLVVCRPDGVFDWAVSREAIKKKCKNGLLIVSGGYGRLESGYVVRIGKDGSDMLSSLIASAIGADRVEFYVETPGLGNNARMTYDEAVHFLASDNAPLDSSVLWPAKNSGIPVVVKSIYEPEKSGTLISAEPSGKAGAPSGILVDGDVELVTVYGTGLLGKVGISSNIFSKLGEAGVNIRFIAQSSSEYSISFAVPSSQGEVAARSLKTLVGGNPMLPLDDVMILNRKVGIVTVYGSSIANIPGVSGRVFSALGDEGVSIIASAQGGEELSISVVVDEKDLPSARKALEKLYK